MARRKRVNRPGVDHLRAWRDAVGLTRAQVAEKLRVDQGTIAKWESGEIPVRVDDLRLLAEVYGITPDRLFFAPSDHRTPLFLREAVEVIRRADPEAVQKWLATGRELRPAKKNDSVDLGERKSLQGIERPGPDPEHEAVPRTTIGA